MQSIIGLIFGQTARVVFKKYTIGELTTESKKPHLSMPMFTCFALKYSYISIIDSSVTRITCEFELKVNPLALLHIFTANLTSKT